MTKLRYCCFLMVISGFISCSASRQLSKLANKEVIQSGDLSNAHIGICIFDPSTGKYLYNYQSEKYFVPASNTKLFTLYAGMKNLGDSLPAIRYAEKNNTIYLLPTGDPSFLHPDFKTQPVVEWLQKITKPILISDRCWKEKPFGFGWSWDDYNSSYMAERSPLPVYGNLIKWTQSFQQNEGTANAESYIYSEPEVNWKVRFNETKSNVFLVRRKRMENVFEITEGKEKSRSIEIPFVTDGIVSALELLKDTVHQGIKLDTSFNNANTQTKTIYSQPSDTLFKIMMHRSDNFFADQVLLMASNEKLGVMDDDKIIDTLLNAELKGIPQRPQWVDGSGLSRYNLFSPQDIVWLLNKMKNEFPWERLTTILPTGDEGTLKNYYLTQKGKIYAKTGTLNAHVAISGYLTTSKGHPLIFSVLVNNHHTSATNVRRAVEKFLLELAAKY